MKLNIKKGLIPETVQLPTSKSYANRALILGAQKKTKTTFSKLPNATDVVHMVNSLRQVGLEIEMFEDGINFLNSFPSCEQNYKQSKVIDVGEGGTTARFLACLLLKGSQPYILKLGKRLKERPWDEFLSFVSLHGANCHLHDDELFIQGPLKLPSIVEIDCSRTTQFATGFALSFSESSQIYPKRLKASMSYWEMTLKLIHDFSNTNYYTTPIDWSSASYSLAFAAHNQKTFFPELKKDPYQADSKFYDLLLSLGMLSQEDNGVYILPKKVSKNITFDVLDCLDLVPTLVFFLSYIDGQHQLNGVRNLVYKESDRLKESMRILEAFEIESRVEGDTLHIRGQYERYRSEVDLVLPDDHRMVMSAALFMRHNAGGTVSPLQAVDKSYPDFFKLFD